MVPSFIDPRTDPKPGGPARPSRTTRAVEALKELHDLCRTGRLYDVERWIADARPLQLAEGLVVRRRPPSALEIALERGDRSLVLLLLCNGYDPNLEERSPLDLALRARRWDILDLLLDWGADAHRVCLDDLFSTYRTALFQRFMDLGVDLTADHELAAALGYHSSNKPLFGFARRHRAANPEIQTELNIALAHHTAEGSEKGVALCLWAGADPHAPAWSLRFGRLDEDEEDDEDRFVGFSAIHEACSRGRVEILEQLGPDPARDDFEDLYHWAGNSAVMEVLARRQLPRDVGSVIAFYVSWWSFRFDGWSLEKLRTLFRLGARWERTSKDEVARVRQSILKLSDQAFEDVMRILSEDDHCAPEVRADLAKTPSIRKRMREVGFYPPDGPGEARYRRYGPRECSRILSSFGIQLPKPPAQPLPPHVHIGTRRSSGSRLELSRSDLFERIWSSPMLALSAEWGMSDRGLAKACRRLKIPVPARGYWAKKAAGHRTRRPVLPKLKQGEAEKVIIWLP